MEFGAKSPILIGFLLVIFFFFITGLNQNANACSCITWDDIEYDFDQEDSVIFSGKVTNYKVQQTSALVTFEINQTWKGFPNNVTSITITESFDSMCTYNLFEESSYLVVAYPWNETLTVSICSATMGLADADEAILFLNNQTVTNSVTDTTQELPNPLVVPPRIQVFNGVIPEDVECKSGFELIFKATNGNPACVSPASATKLIAMGWASA